MTQPRTAILALSLLALSGCASSVRIGGGEDEHKGQWDYEVLHASELAKMNPAEISVIALDDLGDRETIVAYHEALERGLDELGTKGWELVGFHEETYVFRQPREE